MEALEAILTRRSTRKYKRVDLEKELIEKVLEAGRYAPRLREKVILLPGLSRTINGSLLSLVYIEVLENKY